ncbi:MAG: DUF1464 family protein [Acidilobaceae archaeon]
MRAVGVDPGTGSFDVVAVEDGRVVSSRSIPTDRVAREPELLVELVLSLDADVIVAPSGYGVPVTRGDEVLDARRFALEVLLLSSESDVNRGVSGGEFGVLVYDALAKTVEALLERARSKTIFIPSVILLPTVPWWRKINKIDMGTADKLASAYLAVYELQEREGGFEKVNAVVAELGFGYNAAVAVRRGLIVDGVGGTMASTGVITAGCLDLEVVAGAGCWSRWDILKGGLAELGAISLEKAGSEVLEAYAENVAKDVAKALVSTPEAEIVVVTGRHARVEEVRKLLQEKLRDVQVVELRGLPGAGSVKEAAQGYALLGLDLAGGLEERLASRMRIDEACGTVADHLIHPRAAELKRRIRESYSSTVAKPRFCHSI